MGSMSKWKGQIRHAAGSALVRRPVPAGARLVVSVMLVLAALACVQAAQAATLTGAPAVFTGKVGHGRGGALLLRGTINPRGFVTTYHFDYGPTLSYGSQTV